SIGLLTLVIVALVIAIRREHGATGNHVPTLAPMLAALCATAYCSGQWYSLAFRGALMATELTLILTFTLWAWFALMHLAAVPLIWSAAPLPVLLLVSSCSRIDDWLRERHGRQGWRRAAVPLVLPIVLLPIGVAAYRVW